jgi:hypothetical protein
MIASPPSLNNAGAVSFLIGELADYQAYRRIMNAWQMGKIGDERACELLRACGLEHLAP